MSKNPDGVGHYFTRQVRARTRYYWRIYINGTPVERSANSRPALDAKVDQLKQSLSNGYDPTIRLLADFAQMYLRVGTNNLKPRTHNWYESIIRLYISDSPLGNQSIQDITPMEIEAFLANLKGKLSNSYINGIKRCLSVIFSAAVKQGYLSQNPCNAVKAPPTKKRFIYIPSKNQVREWLAIAKSGEYLNVSQYPENDAQILMRKQFYVVLLLAFFSGIRRGEAYSLTWDNVDTQYGRIHIKTTLDLNPTKGHEPLPKTLRSIRSISISQNVLNALRDWKILQDTYAKKYGNLYDNKDNIVFPNTVGHYNSYSNLNRGYWNKFRRYVDSCPNDYHWHDIRHWHVSYLVSIGVKIGEITRRLGHSDPSVTYRIYTHAFDTDDSALINAINNDWD